jgi:resuscitation-promoting factor RpfB
MNRKNGFLLCSCLILFGIALLLWELIQPIPVLDGTTLQTVRSPGLLVGNILNQANIQVFSGDEISPDLNSIVYNSTPIRIRKNLPVTVSLDGNSFPTYSTEEYPANTLLRLGIKLFPGDRLRVDGLRTSTATHFTDRQSHVIQVLRARMIDLNGNQYATTSESIGQIWWESGVRSEKIALASPFALTYLTAGNDLQVRKLSSITITQGQQTSTLPTTGISIDEQLAATGLALQGLDQIISESTEESVKVARVSDRLEMNPKSIPYTTQTGLDDNLELDQKEITTAGEYGLSLQLTRIRAVDGAETDRYVESETILKHPQDEKIGYGTKVQVQSTSVGGATIEYYRELSLYATSYSPCRSGGSKCSSGTASGEPARKGIVAVIPSWYAYMSGQQVYIPGYGYGIIGDTGGGIPGTNWIDLGYNDDDYVSWHSWVTVYFLTPVPANILYTLN